MRRLRIYITCPHKCGRHPLFQRTIALWRTLARLPSPYSGAQVQVLSAARGQSHQELLTQLYAERILPCLTDHDHLISECDFIPDPGALSALHEALEAHALVAAPYITRETDGSLYTNPGRLREYEAAPGVPCLAPWLLSLRLGRAPRLIWLESGGPRNDPANLALQRALADGALPDTGAFLGLEYYDAWSGPRPSACVGYPRFGTHGFFARHVYDKGDTPLMGDLRRDTHFAAYAQDLEEAERAFDGCALTR